MRKTLLMLVSLSLTQMLCFMHIKSSAQAFAAVGYNREKAQDPNQSNQSLKYTLKHLESKFGIFFIYKTQLVIDKTVASFDLNSNDLNKILQDLLTPLGLTYKKVNADTYVITEDKKDKSIQKLEKRSLLNDEEQAKWTETSFQASENLTIKELSPDFSPSQRANVNVKGKITDDKNDPLPGVSVIVKGTTLGTTTDVNGKYSFAVPDNSVLVFSFIGFVTEEIPVGGRSEINVKLLTDIKSLSEVVVVGYGTQNKRELTGSISKVEGDKLMEVQVPSFEAALQGRAAGVQVVQSSGLAGAGSVIRIRGISSVSASGDPLYVVDGIPITQDNFLATNWQNGAMNLNPLATLNPNDIESIEILKDAAAAGIYGSRGANGVILITTKRGKSGKPTFNFSTNVGTSQPVAKPKMLNSQQYLQLVQEAWENDGNVGKPDLSKYGIGVSWDDAQQNNTDWWDLLTHMGIKQSYNLSVTQGKEKLKTYVGLSYSDNQTYIKGNEFERLSGRLNLDYKVTNNLTAKISSSLSRSINHRQKVAYTGGLGEAMSTALPIYPVYDANGEYFMKGSNPIRQRENFRGYTTEWRSINSLNLIFTPVKGLTLNASGSYDYLDQANDQWESGKFLGDEKLYGAGKARQDLRWVDNYNVNAFAEYAFTLPVNHSLKFMVGSEYQKSVTAGKNDITRYNMSETMYKVKESNENDSLVNRGSRMNNQTWSFLSYFSRVSYSFKSKYIFNASARVDGSSRFGPDNRFGFFPTASGAWIVSEEDFLHGSPVVSFLKLKASIGLTGNANFDNNQWMEIYKVESVENNKQGYNGQSIRYPDRLQNPDLKWETTLNWDAGFEASFLNNRINAEFSVYNKLTNGVIMNVSVPRSTGFSTKFDNVGKVANRGVELSLTTKNLTKALGWTTNFNIARNYNEILSIGDYSPDAVSGGTNDTRIFVGKPIGTNYLVRFSRVDPESGRPVYLDKDGYETFEYNEQRDRMPVGKVLPDAFGSVNNSFTYKNFGLSFLIVFTIGGDIYDSSQKRQMGYISNWNMREDVFSRWRASGDQTNIPRLTLDYKTYGNTKEWFNTNQWLHDGSYARLRSITFSYSIPQKLIEKISLRSAKLTFSGTNLLTFTKFQGLDPEIARDFDNQTDRNMSSNITYLTPPQEKSYNFGLNIQF